VAASSTTSDEEIAGRPSALRVAAGWPRLLCRSSSTMFPHRLRLTSRIRGPAAIATNVAEYVDRGIQPDIISLSLITLMSMP
jgi:hypothetical protein